MSLNQPPSTSQESGRRSACFARRSSCARVGQFVCVNSVCVVALCSKFGWEKRIWSNSQRLAAMFRGVDPTEILVARAPLAHSQNEFQFSVKKHACNRENCASRENHFGSLIALQESEDFAEDKVVH